MLKIAIVGTRRRNDVATALLIEQTFFQLLESFSLSLEDVEIVSGGCEFGADRFAEILAKRYNIAIKLFLPKLENAKQYFQMVKAYYARNEQIAEYSDIVIAAVHPDRTGGAENTLKYATKLKRRIILI